MNKEGKFEDLGLKDYKDTWDYQEKIFSELIQAKLDNRSLPEESQKKILNRLIFVEHPHVYTLGKSGSDQNLLINSIQLRARDASFYRINRGGDITYHGPGQLVVYPIFDLEVFGLTLKAYIERLEEVIINTIAGFGLKGERLDGATGVWLDPGQKGNERKICAIGVKASRYVTMHGLAFNVNTRLDYFDYINPCGFTDKKVTSLEKELGEKQDFEKIKGLVKSGFETLFGVEFR